MPQGDGEDQQEDCPLGDRNEPVDSHLDEEVVKLDVQDPDAGDDKASQGAVAYGEHHCRLHSQPEHLGGYSEVLWDFTS